MKDSADKSSPSKQQNSLSKQAVEVLTAVDALLGRADDLQAGQINKDISYE